MATIADLQALKSKLELAPVLTEGLKMEAETLGISGALHTTTIAGLLVLVNLAIRRLKSPLDQGQSAENSVVPEAGTGGKDNKQGWFK